LPSLPLLSSLSSL
jgi:hypothetical protein